MSSTVQERWGLAASQRKRLPQPVLKDWKDGILEVREDLPSVPLPRKLFDRPDRSQLIEAPILEAMMSHLVPHSDLGLVEWAEGSEQSLEDHMQGMWGSSGGRLCFSRASMALVHYIFDTYAPGDNFSVAETGCGPELLLWELAPQRLQQQWHAFDIEHQFAGLAQEKAELFKLPVTVDRRNAYQPFAPGPIEPRPNLWVGLSSYDAVDVSLALEGMQAAPGTKFIHIQDLYPAVDTLIHFGRKFPEKETTWLVSKTKPVISALNDMQMFIQMNLYNNAFSLLNQFMMNREKNLYFERQDRVLSPVEEFHDRLVFCLDQAGFRIVKAGLISSTYVGEMLAPHYELTTDFTSRGLARPNTIVNVHGDYPILQHGGVFGYHRDLGHSFDPKKAFMEMTIANFVVAEKL